MQRILWIWCCQKITGSST